MSQLSAYAKAVLAAIVAALSALGAALTDGGVSASEWVAVALAFFVALGTVFAVPNGNPQPTGVQDPEA